MIEALQRSIQSQTWRELQVLLRELAPERRRFLAVVLLASLMQGLVDIFFGRSVSALGGLAGWSQTW